MAITGPFFADNGSVYIVGTNVVQKEYKSVVTEFKVTPGDRDIEVVPTFSDEYVSTKRPELTEVTMTVVASGGDLPLYILGGSGANVYPRSYTGNSTRVRADVKWQQFDENSTAQKQWIISGAYLTSFEESNATDEATSWDLTWKTLPSNTTYKWTPNAAASGLPAL